MYISKDIYRHVMKLFKEQPKYRDDRWDTLDYVVDTYYKDIVGKGRIYHKLIFDIDRAFRLVQQRVPELRGETWIERQVQAGELTKDILSEIQKHCVQLKLNYE